MTIASDFYALLKTFGDGAVEPGTPGRNLHNRIAELEEVHATLRSGFQTVVDEESLLSGRYADLQRIHARLQAKYKSALRDIARNAEMETEHTAMTRELAPARLGRKLALDDAAAREVEVRRQAGEPAVSYDDIRAAFEGSIGK